MPSSIASCAVDSPQSTETMDLSPAFSTISTSDGGIISRIGETQGLPVRITSPAAGAPQAMGCWRKPSITPWDPTTSSSNVLWLRRANSAALPPTSSLALVRTNSTTCLLSFAVDSSRALRTSVVRWSSRCLRRSTSRALINAFAASVATRARLRRSWSVKGSLAERASVSTPSPSLPASRGTATNERGWCFGSDALKRASVRLSRTRTGSRCESAQPAIPSPTLKRDISLIAIGLLRAASTLSSSCSSSTSASVPRSKRTSSEAASSTPSRAPRHSTDDDSRWAALMVACDVFTACSASAS